MDSESMRIVEEMIFPNTVEEFMDSYKVVDTVRNFEDCESRKLWRGQI